MEKEEADKTLQKEQNEQNEISVIVFGIGGRRV